MKTEELLASTGETFEYARQYIDQQKQLILLEVAEKTAKTTSSLITSAIIGFLAVLFLIMLSITVGFWLGKIWDSYAAAFLVITGFYAMLGLTIYFFQKQFITNPILDKVLSELLD